MGVEGLHTRSYLMMTDSSIFLALPALPDLQATNQLGKRQVAPGHKNNHKPQRLRCANPATAQPHVPSCQHLLPAAPTSRAMHARHAQRANAPPSLASPERMTPRRWGPRPWRPPSSGCLLGQNAPLPSEALKPPATLSLHPSLRLSLTLPPRPSSSSPGQHLTASCCPTTLKRTTHAATMSNVTLNLRLPHRYKPPPALHPPFPFSYSSSSLQRTD